MASWGSRTGGRDAVSPQLGRRVAIMGAVALGLFAVIFFRLWFLQVLDGNHYLQQAQDNQVRIVPVAPPRGQILDRNGNVLVDNSTGTVVQLLPNKLPPAERNAALTWGQEMSAQARKPKAQRTAIPIPQVDPALAGQFDALAKVLRVRARDIQVAVVHQLVVTPFAPIRLKVGVATSVRNYLLERSDDFPAVGVQQVYLRKYPQGDLAAQLFGTTGAVTAAQLKEKQNRGLPDDAVIGQEGLEYQYDEYLRGVAGADRVVVDAAGRPKSSRVTQQPVAGRSVKLTLDLGLQKAGQAALSQYLTPPADAGAFVAMDPRNGAILAMGSAPTFDPKVLTKPITQQKYNQLFGTSAGAPRFNRAISGAYPTGSIFKPITALAGLKSGTLNPNVFYDDNGFIKLGTERFQNAGAAANGPVNLVDAIRVSSDVYFYEQGLKMNGLKGQVLQKEAHALGLGQRTGIDLPGEFPGTVPDRAWRARLNREEAACEKRTHVKVCGIADGTDRPWSAGDNLQLAVGQGDLQASPLQMAVMYSALANGGTVVKPHIGSEILGQDGRVDQTVPTGTGHKVAMPAGYQDILEGLHEATADAGGTSADVFSEWPQSQYKLYGKTGTAQRGLNPDGSERPDQSWFAAFVDDPKRPIVIVTTVEDGGFGAETAAPATCLMLKHWYNVPKISCAPGASKTQ